PDAEVRDRGGGRVHLIGRARGDGHVTAFPGQGARDLTTDAAAPAGDAGGRSRGRARHGRSAQNRKTRGRVPDALSRDGSDKQRTRGGVLSRGGLLLRLVDAREGQTGEA